jgi:PAS domain S-box-containing protein
MNKHHQPDKSTLNQPAPDYAVHDGTQQQRDQEALRISEEKYRTLFESIDEGFHISELIYDHNNQVIDWRFLEVNQVFERQTGLHNVVGQLGSVIAPNTERHWLLAYDQIVQTGKPVRLENYNGSTGRWYSLYASRVGGASSRQFAVVFDDITERKQSQQHQAFLLKFSDALRTQPNADAVANCAVQLLLEELGLDRCYIGVYRLAEDRGEFTHQVGNDRVPPVPDSVRLSDFPDALRVAFEGTLVIDDVGKTAGLTEMDRQNLGALGFSALVASTLRHGEGNPLWSMVAISARPRRWTPTEIKLIDEVTERTWTAIERVNVEEALRLNQQRTRIQNEAFQSAINGEPLATSLNTLTQMVNPQLGSEVRTVFYLAYPDGASLHAIEGAGDMPQTYTGPVDGFPIGEASFCSGRAIATGRPALTRDVLEDPLWQPYRQLASDHNFRSCSSYPILARDGKAIGSFALYFTQVHEATAQEFALADAVTQAAALILSRHTEALERARADEALRQSDERFRTLVQNLPDYAIFRIDPEGIITEWTEGAQRVKGYTAEEVVGQSIALFYTPEGLAAGELTTEMEQATQAGRAERESVRIRKGGGRFWVNEIMTAIRDEQGRLVGFTKISRDITERKKAEEALFDSRQRLQIVLDSIAEHAIITFDLQHRIVSWNPGSWQMFGYTAEEAIGQSGEIFFTPEDREAGQMEHEMRMAREQGQAPDERYHLRKDGSRLYVSGTMAPLFDADKTLLGYVKVARDLTDRRRMEQVLREADRRKDEFLAMLAHELRNPLAPIRNGLQILSLTEGANPDLAPLVELMSRQLTHLVRLVDDLLDVSRISQGKIELKRERLDLGTLVGGAVEAARPLYQTRGKTLDLALPTTPLLVDGDATRLAQVVTNLLTNGSRYTGENGQVRVTLESIQGEARLRVTDNGIGLEAEQLDAIFELFVQVDNSVARSQGGLGLGLTLVKQLVELHGGRVDVRSAGLGQGSEFSVYLPLLSADKLQPAINQVTPQPTLQPPLLVIDDNADAALTLAMLLKLKGYQVHTRSSGRAGLEAAEQVRPAAILLDIGMPDLDGYETCRLLRQQPWGKSVPVIALTGYGQAEDLRRTHEAGFNAHLVKPVDLVALTQLLTQLLAG